MMNKILSLAILFAFFTACTSCSSGSTNDNETTTETPKPEPIPTPPDSEDFPTLTKPQFSNCLVKTSDKKLEIATWNVERFPKTCTTTANVADWIKKMDVDVIALQEIKSKSYLDNLAALLPDWKAVIYARSDMNLAFLYKESEIEIDGNPYAIPEFRNNSTPFPRSPYALPIHSKSTGLDVLIVNNHLKAKSGSSNENRRRQAIRLLKEWIDNKHSDENVVVLGDMNDSLTDAPSSNVFQTIIDEPTKYYFADMYIAKDKSKDQWSYPSWPSHLDHILVTNELYDNTTSVYTYELQNCYRQYRRIISDHLPVCIVLKADE